MSKSRPGLLITLVLLSMPVAAASWSDPAHAKMPHATTTATLTAGRTGAVLESGEPDGSQGGGKQAQQAPMPPPSTQAGQRTGWSVQTAWIQWASRIWFVRVFGIGL